jgi:hypothetical protein
LRSDVDRRFCESVDADSLDSCLRNRESDAPDEMCAKFFLSPDLVFSKSILRDASADANAVKRRRT